MSVAYTTHGSVRGGCGHRHRSIRTALGCLERDRRGCAQVGGYSDRRVVALECGTRRDLELNERETLECEMAWRDASLIERRDFQERNR